MLVYGEQKMSRLSDFMRARAKETYPENRTDLHNNLTYEMAEKVAKLIPADAKVIDIGCGQGPALEWFTKNGFDVSGITTNSEDMIACLDKGHKVRICDQNDMPPMWTGSFGLVWARHVLEHSICPFFTLHEFNRILKANGILYVEVPSPATVAMHETNKNHYSVMGWQMWASLIDRAGFEILEAKTIQLTLANNSGLDAYFSYTCKKQ